MTIDPRELGFTPPDRSGPFDPEDVLLKTRNQMANQLGELRNRAWGFTRSRGDDVETEAAASIFLGLIDAALYALNTCPVPHPRIERSRRVLQAMKSRLNEAAFDGFSTRKRTEKWGEILAAGVPTFCLVSRPDVQIGQQIADHYVREGTLMPGLDGGSASFDAADDGEGDGDGASWGE